MTHICTFEQVRKNLTEIKYNQRGATTAVITTVCVFIACIITPIAATSGIIKERVLTDIHSYTATAPADGKIKPTTQAVNTPLSATVFGARYKHDVQNAMDAQAYSKAVAYETEIQAYYVAEQERIADAERFYIPEITLDYEAEKMYVPYETQKYIWDMCNELNLDYFLVMGIIARESRFQLDIVSCTDGVYYYGGMQISGKYWYDIAEMFGGDTTIMTPQNVYDNLWLGMHLLAYCIEETGGEASGVMAFGMGLDGYYASIASGVYTCSDVEKAYKFRKLLLQNERYNSTVDGDLAYDM